MNYLQGTTEHEIYTVLAAGFLAGGSRQEKASVRLPCSGKKLAANERCYDQWRPSTELHEPKCIAGLGCGRDSADCFAL